MKKINIFIIIILLFYTSDVFAIFSFKNNKACKLFKKGEYQKALKKYMDSQIENPESPILHYNMGNVYYEQRKYDKAIDELNKSLAIKNNSIRSKAYYNIGNSYFRQYDFMQAIEFYKKALELNPNDQDAKYNIEIARKKVQENMQNQQDGDNSDNKDKNKQKKQQNSNKSDKNKKKNKDNQKDKADKRDNNKMSKENAKRLLDALKDDEKKTQKKLKRIPGGGRAVDKDW